MTPRPKLAFIAPALPTIVAESPTGDEWMHEVKYDGYRALAVLEDGRARIFTRRGHDYRAACRASPRRSPPSVPIGRPRRRGGDPRRGRRLGFLRPACVRSLASTHQRRSSSPNLLHLDGEELRDRRSRSAAPALPTSSTARLALSLRPGEVMGEGGLHHPRQLRRDRRGRIAGSRAALGAAGRGPAGPLRLGGLWPHYKGRARHPRRARRQAADRRRCRPSLPHPGG